MIREHWTPAIERQARKVYDTLVAANPTKAKPMSRAVLSRKVGLLYESECSGLVAWAMREISSQTGVYIASRRGPGGGYWITADRQEAIKNEVAVWMEQWNHLRRAIASTEQLIRLHGRTASLRRTFAAEKEALRQVEEALAEHKVFVGSTKVTVKVP